jgi:hypothetical protein
VCSAEENSDLYYSIPWSHGTLGFVVSVQLKIIPSKQFVQMTYFPFSNKECAIAKFASESRSKECDFVECLAFSPSEYVVMTGMLIFKFCTSV